MWTHTRESQRNITPDIALSYLKEGNQRFISNLQINRDLLQQVNQTSKGQFPFATVLSCIDSRTSAELIFDQGLGDIFSIRIAGNVLNDDILGSMEYTCKVARSRLIVVLGHTKCAAIASACNNLQMGRFTGLLNKLQLAIEAEKSVPDNPTGSNTDFINKVTIRNIHLTIRQIRQQSKILSELEHKNKIGIIGGLYDVGTGMVEFMKSPG